MMLLLPPIGLAACALPAPRSKAAAAKIGNADFIGDSLSEECRPNPDMCLGPRVWMRRLASGCKQKTKGPGATPGPSDLCVTLSCQPPLLVPPPLAPMPLLAPLLVLPPLPVPRVWMPDA